MKDFDAILGLDWLEEHYALIDYRRKRVVLHLPSEKEFFHPLIQTGSEKFIVLAMKVARLMSKGCSVFLACVIASLEANQSSLLEAHLSSPLPSLVHHAILWKIAQI